MERPYWFSSLSLLWILLLISLSSISYGGIEITDKQGQVIPLYKDYHALVVGIGNYDKWPKLPAAVNDAKEVAGKLKEMGFVVKLVSDPTAVELRAALNEMVYGMGTEVNRGILFYFAGHGETEVLADKTKMGYIIPRDCPLLSQNPIEFASHAISMKDIDSVSLRIHSKHLLMVFDSCFSGGLFTLVRSIPHDISEKSALPVRQYITAGKQDEQVPDQSMFKRSFLHGLNGDADLTGDGYVTGSELGMYLSDKVVNYTNRGQHPQYGRINNPDLDKGDFVFVASKDKGIHSRARAERGEKMIASVPKEVTDPEVQRKRIALRSGPIELREPEVDRMIMQGGFFVRYKNPKGGFPNDFVDNGDGTLTDKASGLMWQKSGSPSRLDANDIKRSLDELNTRKFAGYDDWRTPTLEELCSLLEAAPNKKGLERGLGGNLQSFKKILRCGVRHGYSVQT
jgi:hypothetical protein